MQTPDTTQIDHDDGPSRPKPQRMCIVSRKTLPISQLIRFVASPDTTLTPDVKRKLPGRGVWVSATRSQVEVAIKRKAFARGLKTAIIVPDNLTGLIEKLLEADALQAFSLANKAGKVIFGQTKVESEIAGGKVIAVLHSIDAAVDSIRKVAQAIKRREGTQISGIKPISVLFPFQSKEMSLCLGRDNVIHTCLIDSNASKQCLEKCEILLKYKGLADKPDKSA